MSEVKTSDQLITLENIIDTTVPEDSIEQNSEPEIEEPEMEEPEMEESEIEESEMEEPEMEESEMEEPEMDEGSKNITMNPSIIDESLIETEEEEEEEENLQKFTHETKEQFILNNHPEIIQHNNDEIALLSKIVRDKNKRIIDPYHKTIPFITKYERAKILGTRAKQINRDAPVFVSVPENIIDGYTIALLEYKAKKIPFIVRRPIPNGGCEYWKFEDLEQVDF